MLCSGKRGASRNTVPKSIRFLTAPKHVVRGQNPIPSSSHQDSKKLPMIMDVFPKNYVIQSVSAHQIGPFLVIQLSANHSKSARLGWWIQTIPRKSHQPSSEAMVNISKAMS